MVSYEKSPFFSMVLNLIFSAFYVLSKGFLILKAFANFENFVIFEVLSSVMS